MVHIEPGELDCELDETVDGFGWLEGSFYWMGVWDGGKQGGCTVAAGNESIFHGR
jgi:hypothetical protein